jgi:hypothetical protein
MSRTRQVVCFCEDIAHERFIKALIQRAGAEKNVAVQIKVLNATHGSKVWNEFRQYLRELKAGTASLLDILVVVMDGNCQTAAKVRKDIEEEVMKVGLTIPHLICAVPDPHIERWYLEDQHAFKKVLPKVQPRKLRYKCERDRYKRALVEAIRAADIEPLLGGAEYGEEIAQDLDPAKLDRSFRAFWKDLGAALGEHS